MPSRLLPARGYVGNRTLLEMGDVGREARPPDLRSEMMDSDAQAMARIMEHWEASERGDSATEHAIYAADAILDYPQSGERFRGRVTIAAQRGGHPADRHFTVTRIVGRGDLWVR